MLVRMIVVIPVNPSKLRLVMLQVIIFGGIPLNFTTIQVGNTIFLSLCTTSEMNFTTIQVGNTIFLSLCTTPDQLINTAVVAK